MKTARPEPESSARGVIEAVTKIARERTQILESMKAALVRGDDEEALEKARELTGLPPKRTISQS